MSDSGPPPESKQLIATEDSVQAGQPTKWDFLKQQTVTLTLNLNDILKNENQPLLNNCEFSVSGRMAFTCQNCEKPPTDSTLQVCNAKDNDFTFQSFRRGQQACDSEIQKIVDAINNNTAILHASSDLLQKCAKRLEELISSFDAPPGNNDESGKVKQKVEREIKDTTSTVIRMLEESRGDTGTVDSNDDDDDKPASDDDDSDGLSKESGDPKGTDNPKGPTNLPDDSSKKDEGLTGNHHTDLAQEHNEHESTEFFDAVIGSQEKQAKLTESVSASEMDKQEIGEDQKQGEDDSEPQQIKSKLAKSSEKAPNAEEDLRQGNESPKESSALEDLLVSEPPNSQEQKERMKSEFVEPTLPEIDNAENSTQVLPLTASTQNQMEREEQSEAITKDITAVEIDAALSLIEDVKNESGDVESILLPSEMDKQGIKHEVGGNSEEIPNAEEDPQQEDGFPQELSTLEDPLLSESTANQTVQEELKETSPEDVEVLASVRDESGHDEPSLPASEIDKREGDSEETTDAGSDPHQQAKLSQQSSAPVESVIAPKSDNNEAPVGGNSEEIPNAEADPQQEDGFPQKLSTLEDPLLFESTVNQKVQEELTETSSKDVEALLLVKDKSGRDAEKEDPDKDSSLDEEVDIDLEHPVSPDVCSSPVHDSKCEGAEEEEVVTPVPAEDVTPTQEGIVAPVQAGDVAPMQVAEAPVQAEGDMAPVPEEGVAPMQAGDMDPMQDGIVAPVQAEGETQVQAAGVAPMQGDGVTPVQAEGEVPVQAGDGTPVQAGIVTQLQEEGVTSVHAEDVTPVQAERVTLSGKPTMEDKLGKTLEVVPDAGSSLQQEAELPQKPSTPALSVIEEISTESRSDNSRNDGNLVSQPDVQLQKENDCDCHGGKTCQPVTLTSKQLKKKNKKEVQKDKNLKKKYGFDEKDAFGTSVEVMLSTFLAEMNDIQKKQTKPCDIKFSKTLKGISLFYKNDYCKQHTMDPQDVFKKLLGDKWEEKNDSESEICKQLICFLAQEAYKTSAQNMIAYLHNEYNKVKNPKEKASFTKKLLAVFTEEIVPWVEGKWLQNVKDYAEYRMQELEGQSKVYAWKDEPAKYNENQRVRDRIEYYKKQLDTVENRLILDCYSFLIFQAERLIRYHKILDSDLDYMCSLPKATIKKTELKFFKAIYGLDDELIAKMLGETKRVIKREMQEPESYEETTFIEEERFQKHHLIHFLLSVNVTNLPFAPGKLQRNKYLNDFCKFRLSENIDKYRDATLEIVTLKLLGPKESWKDKNEKEHQLFRVLEELIVDNTKIRHCAEEMIAYIEHLYTLTSEDKECFAETFTDSLEADLQTWLACQLNDQLQKYVKHHEDCRKHFKVIEKYCWKPRPQSYKTSEFFDDREQYHWLRSNTKDINTFYSEYYLDNINVLKSFSGGEEILNEDFDYLSTRSRKEMRKEEYQFFFAIFPYDFS